MASRSFTHLRSLMRWRCSFHILPLFQQPLEFLDFDFGVADTIAKRPGLFVCTRWSRASCQKQIFNEVFDYIFWDRLHLKSVGRFFFGFLILFATFKAFLILNLTGLIDEFLFTHCVLHLMLVKVLIK